MAEAVIPVDLFNPGQVFACLGLLEAADALVGAAQGGFDWRDSSSVQFLIRANGERSPVAVVLDFLERAEVVSLAPAGSPHSTARWNVRTITLPQGAPFPFPDPPSPATLPAKLVTDSATGLAVDYWGDAARRDAAKFWAGSGGYPGAAILRDALSLVRGRLADAVDDPFALTAPQSSSFRFDMRRDYIPMDVGFSPNLHGDVKMLGYPLVEILAAIGLGSARPMRHAKLQYTYSVLAAMPRGRPPTLLLHRAALSGAELPFPRRTFKMSMGWPGQENQARCITTVVEEAYE